MYLRSPIRSIRPRSVLSTRRSAVIRLKKRIRPVSRSRRAEQEADDHESRDVGDARRFDLREFLSAVPAELASSRIW